MDDDKLMLSMISTLNIVIKLKNLSRNPPYLVTEEESAQEFFDEQDNEEDLVNPICNLGKVDVKDGDDIDQSESTR
eukprot:14480756-Ditylum_brightwellii.AAC.1